MNSAIGAFYSLFGRLALITSSSQYANLRAPSASSRRLAIGSGSTLYMKLLYDFFPVILFFVAYKAYDIYVATGVIIVASLVQISVHWFRHRTVNRMHLTTAVLVVIFGGITLALRDPAFIKWKPTVVNWLFAAVFLGSQFIGQKPVVQRMMEGIYADTHNMSSDTDDAGGLELSATDWRALNTMWWVFFIVLGAINLYVVYNFSENTWVNFKLFGMLGLTLVFALLQGVWIAHKLPGDER